jgi:hypothetical protein
MGAQGALEILDRLPLDCGQRLVQGARGVELRRVAEAFSFHRTDPQTGRHSRALDVVQARGGELEQEVAAADV